MKKLLTTISVFLLVLGMSVTLNAQDSGEFWIKTFSPGSSDLNDPSIDADALAKLDSLMQNEHIEITFLGAADKKAWHLDGRPVHKNISVTWNDAKRLSRARALRARYGRGLVGVTHEDIAGVKVAWTTKTAGEVLTEKIDELKTELAQVKTELNGIKGTNGTNGHGTNGKNGHGPGEIRVNRGVTFNWKLQGGFWTWTSGSENIVTPTIGLNIIIGNTAFVIQGGVSPWQTSSQNGNQAESLFYTGAKHMRTETLGISVGVFRGWRFFTETDTWSFTTTGLATGVVLKYKRLEFNPNLTYSRSNFLVEDSKWRVGGSLGINLNIN